MKVGSRISLFVPVVFGLAACGEEVVKVPSPPTKARYQINFPSTRVAVATEAIQVSVFDATNGAQSGTDCLTLVTKQKIKADLPKAPLFIAQTDVIPICDILGGTNGALPTISYGKRTFIAVAKRGNADFFLGCSEANIGPGDALVDISVAQADETVQVPTTTCATLGDKCKSPPCN
jgi:hypothetical protein